MTEFNSVILPHIDKSWLCQLGNLASILSTKNCQSSTASFWLCKGRPKYLIENPPLTSKLSDEN